ncbi:hypothetical protein HBB16_07805 [Pseudonocardia sp. MCCB 268]|nr:hypothetical protein [Pseudonocardia cytotoxica]
MYQAILPIRGASSTSRRPDRPPRPQEHRGPVDHHGDGHRYPRRLRPREAPYQCSMADADVDGMRTSGTSLLTLLFRFMRPLIENGHALAQPPLYKIKWEGTRGRAGDTTLTASGTARSRRWAARPARSCPRTRACSAALGEMNAKEPGRRRWIPPTGCCGR